MEVIHEDFVEYRIYGMKFLSFLSGRYVLRVHHLRSDI